MSIDCLVCNYCEDTFSDCGYWVSCESCGTKWCSDECANEDGYIPEHCGKHPNLDTRQLMKEYRETYCSYEDCCYCDDYIPDSCKYCRKEDYSSEFLLTEALNMLNLTRQGLVNLINTKEKKE